MAACRGDSVPHRAGCRSKGAKARRHHPSHASPPVESASSAGGDVATPPRVGLPIVSISIYLFVVRSFVGLPPAAVQTSGLKPRDTGPPTKEVSSVPAKHACEGGVPTCETTVSTGVSPRSKFSSARSARHRHSMNHFLTTSAAAKGASQAGAIGRATLLQNLRWFSTL